METEDCKTAEDLFKLHGGYPFDNHRIGIDINHHNPDLLTYGKLSSMVQKGKQWSLQEGYVALHNSRDDRYEVYAGNKKGTKVVGNPIIYFYNNGDIVLDPTVKATDKEIIKKYTGFTVLGTKRGGKSSLRVIMGQGRTQQLPLRITALEWQGFLLYTANNNNSPKYNKNLNNYRLLEELVDRYLYEYFRFWNGANWDGMNVGDAKLRQVIPYPAHQDVHLSVTDTVAWDWGQSSRERLRLDSSGKWLPGVMKRAGSSGVIYQAMAVLAGFPWVTQKLDGDSVDELMSMLSPGGAPEDEFRKYCEQAIEYSNSTDWLHGAVELDLAAYRGVHMNPRKVCPQTVDKRPNDEWYNVALGAARHSVYELILRMLDGVDAEDLRHKLTHDVNALCSVGNGHVRQSPFTNDKDLIGSTNPERNSYGLPPSIPSDKWSSNPNPYPRALLFSVIDALVELDGYSYEYFDGLCRKTFDTFDHKLRYGGVPVRYNHAEFMGETVASELFTFTRKFFLDRASLILPVLPYLDGRITTLVTNEEHFIWRWRDRRESDAAVVNETWDVSEDSIGMGTLHHFYADEPLAEEMEADTHSEGYNQIPDSAMDGGG